ncbi:MAG: hypothetical protein E7262_02960 [Lachnospiraceae bacterium]|nr:hypothetical protein [Lachnospiraceae bacterium]
MHSNNKKVCIMGGSVYFIGLILTILLGVVLDIRFEVLNAMFVIIAILYAVVMSKIQGDDDVLKNRTILVSSAAAKLLFIFSMVYESELWWSAAEGKDMAFYFYMSYIIFFVFQVIETVLFYINKVKLFRLYVMIVGLMSYLALVLYVNSYWVLIVPIVLLTAYSQCNDVKLVAIGGIATSLVTICGSFTQSQYYDTGVYAFITDIPKLLKNALTNSLREDSEYMFCVYLLIISAFCIYAFAMVRITYAVKTFNADKIKAIEQEQVKVEKLIDKIVKIGMKVKSSATDTNVVINELEDALEESNVKMDEISADNEKNVERIEKQTDMTLHISDLIKDVAIEVDKASKSTKQILKELDNSKKSYKNLKIRSNEIYANNNQVIRVIADFVENVRQVESIIQDINYISEETNLLSFNTYVKSARAGEVGKGFAVVASKIRSLAESTSGLTDNIKDIVNKLEQNANVVQQVINEVVDAINEENGTIDKTMLDFNSMDKDIHCLSENVYGISERVNSVTSFTTEIEKHIGQLKSLSEGVTAHGREVVVLNKESKEKIINTRVLMEEMLDTVNELEEFYSVVK